MLFMPFLLVLTLFAQSACCPKEDGETRPATKPRPAEVFKDIHDLSKYPVIPEYTVPKPKRPSYRSKKEFKKATYDWRSHRRVDAITKVYAKKDRARQMLKEAGEILISKEESRLLKLDLGAQIITEEIHRVSWSISSFLRHASQQAILDRFSTASNLIEIIRSLKQRTRCMQRITTQILERLELGFPLTIGYHEKITPNLTLLLNKVNPPNWKLIKEWRRRENGELYFLSREEILDFNKKFTACMESLCTTLKRTAIKSADTEWLEAQKVFDSIAANSGLPSIEKVFDLFD